LLDFYLLIQPGDAQLVRRLIAETRNLPSIGQRIKLISARFVGYPYLRNPLIGSPTKPEVFVSRLDGFDCVTYIETVLALAGARSVEDFLIRLRGIRYVNGTINWWRRLHFMTDWSRHQVQCGILVDLTTGEDTVVQTKMLTTIAGLRPKISSYRYFPKHRLNLISPTFKDGDVIYFVSGRKGLDILHAGIIIWNNNRLLMRHATRRRHAVVEQSLDNFVYTNLMNGFIINRPA
jgi:hypothetical protein